MARAGPTPSFMSDDESFRSALQVIDVDVIEPGSPLLGAELQPVPSLQQHERKQSRQVKTGRAAVTGG